MPSQERTPLLAHSHNPSLGPEYPLLKDLLNIIDRLTRSSWGWLTHGKLVFSRGLILAYLTAVTPVLVYYKIKSHSATENGSPWASLFDFSTATYTWNWFLALLAFGWNFLKQRIRRHFRKGRHNVWEAAVLAKIAPSKGSSPYADFYLSLLYTAVQVSSYLNAIMYLAGGDGGETVSMPLDEEWLRGFYVINLYYVPALLSAIDTLVLNDVKRHESVPSHAAAVAVLLGSYLGWASFGSLVTGQYPYRWMDSGVLGKRSLVAAYSAGFIGIGLAVFGLTYGLHVFKEKLIEQVYQGGLGCQTDDSDVEDGQNGDQSAEA